MEKQPKNKEIAGEVLHTGEYFSQKDETVSVSSDSDQEDVTKMETVELVVAAKILGLKYHTARDFLLREPTIRGYDYGFKKVWIKKDILNFKRNHQIKK